MEIINVNLQRNYPATIPVKYDQLDVFGEEYMAAFCELCSCSTVMKDLVLTHVGNQEHLLAHYDCLQASGREWGACTC